MINIYIYHLGIYQNILQKINHMKSHESYPLWILSPDPWGLTARAPAHPGADAPRRSPGRRPRRRGGLLRCWPRGLALLLGICCYGWTMDYGLWWIMIMDVKMDSLMDIMDIICYIN